MKTFEDTVGRLTLKYVGPDGSTTVTREFEIDTIYDLNYHILQFYRQIGFEYIESLTVRSCDQEHDVEV